jgi:2-dehydro-3-deoxygluconokinase
MKMYDVVSIGETMLRLTPPHPLRFEQATSLDVHVGGSESNTLVGLSRLGAKTCWISRLPDHAMGQQIARQIGMHGVDTSHVLWSKEDRLGVYYYEPACFPRPGEVIYDRKDSAFTRLSEQELPLGPLLDCRWFHATGISLALNAQLRSVMEFARKKALSSGAKISFDFNYRAKLWGVDQAREGSREWVESSDLVFFAKRDAISYLQIASDSSDEAVIDELSCLRSGKLTVVTLGEDGAIASEAGTRICASTWKVEGAGRLGGGDAFSAGFLFGRLNDWPLAESLAWANAMAGLKYSISGDMPIIQRKDIERILTESRPKGVDR